MSQIHAKTDKLSLVAVPLPEGKMRVTSQSWHDPLVILPHLPTASPTDEDFVRATTLSCKGNAD